MTDPAEDISDALVAYINGLVAQDPSPLSMMCRAENPDDPNAQLKAEHTDLQVFFFPYSDEEEEKRGRGGEILETIIVTMMVARQITTTYTRKLLGGFVREIKANIRKSGKKANYTYSRAETVTKFDVDALHETSKKFISIVRLHYIGFAA